LKAFQVTDGPTKAWVIAMAASNAAFSALFGVILYVGTRAAWTSIGVALLFAAAGTGIAFYAAKRIGRTAGSAPAESKGGERDASGMEEAIRRISELSDEVAATSNSLASNTEFCTDMVVGISESIQMISSGSETIAESARTNMLMLEEVSKGMEHIAESSLGLAHETAEVAGQAGDGVRTVDRAIAQMMTIHETAIASADTVSKTESRMEEIDRIAMLMTEIASQINLLSLNAAIEAARAGEYGRGFAVVADEIRKLADQSSFSAKGIAKTVVDIREGSRLSTLAMDQVMLEVETGAKLVAEAGEAFREIVRVTEQVSGKVQEVSGVTEEVSSSAEQILTSVRDTASITEVALAGTKEIATCSDDQLGAMEESLQSARKLQDQAKRLKELLDRVANG